MITKHDWLLVILVLACLIRLPGMFQSLWYDESFTAAISALPWDRLWQATAGDVHPPLWYAIEKFVILALGNSELALRLPSLILGIVNVWLTWKVANSMGLPENVARIAILIVAIMPGQVWYSNEARMYQLVEFAGLLAVLGVYQRRWWLYGLGLALGLWSHNLFVLFAEIPAILAYWGRIRWRHLALNAPMLATAAAGLAYAPWLVNLADQMSDVSNGFWVLPVNLGTPIYTLHRLLWASIVPAWAGVHAIFVSALLLAIGTLYTWKARRFDILVLAFGQLVLVAIISVIWRPVLIGRVLMPSAPFVTMVLAYSLAGRRRGPALAILAVPLLVVALTGYISGATGRQDMHAFAEPVTLSARPGDVVFHGNLASYMLMSYYLPEQQHYVWRQANDLSQSLTRQTKNAMGLPETDLAELQTARVSRVWFYWSLNPTTSQAEYAYITAALATFENTEVAVFQNDQLIDARLYLIDVRKLK